MSQISYCRTTHISWCTTSSNFVVSNLCSDRIHLLAKISIATDATARATKLPSLPDIWVEPKYWMSLAPDAPAEWAKLLYAVHDVSEIQLSDSTTFKHSLSHVLQPRAADRSADVLAAFQMAQETLRPVHTTVHEIEGDKQ